MLTVVLIGGFLAPTNVGLSSYWGKENLKPKEEMRILTVHPSPVGSVHDRACEIFYAIKGGQIDFGSKHAEMYDHDRFGNIESGLHPNWSSKYPIHLVGHSFGGNTIRYLQHLLASQQFEGYNTDETWVSSISCINSPLNGSLLPYGLGARVVKDARVVVGSIGFILTFLIMIVEFIDSPTLRHIYDWKMDHWRVSHKKYGFCNALKRIFALMASSDLTGGKIWEDNAANDMSIIKAEKDNRVIQSYPSTHYFSFTGGRSMSSSQSFGISNTCTSNNHCGCIDRTAICVSIFAPVLSLHSNHGNFKIFTKKEFEIGDGICSVITQAHPKIPKPHKHKVMCSMSNILSTQKISKGVWHVFTEEDLDHFGLVGLPKCTRKQNSFFNLLYKILIKINNDESEAFQNKDIIEW